MTEKELLVSLSPEKVNSLSIQAQDYWEDGSLFQILKTEMDRVASITIFQKSNSLDDILAGKMILYTNDLWAKKIKRLANELPNEAQRVGR